MEAMKKFARAYYERWEKLPRWLRWGVVFIAIDALLFMFAHLLHYVPLWEFIHLPVYAVIIPLVDLAFAWVTISELTYDLIVALVGPFILGTIFGLTGKKWLKRTVIVLMTIVIVGGLVFASFAPFFCIKIMDAICTIIPDFEAAGFACIPFAAVLDGVPSAVPTIRGGVEDKTMTDMCRKLLMEFLENDQESCPILMNIAADKSESEFLRRYAVHALGLIDDNRAIDVLIRLLDNENRELQLAAAGALSRISEVPEDMKSRASGFLIRMLGDKLEDHAGKRAIVNALGNIKAANSLEHLIPLLRDSEWLIRSDTAKALGKIDDQRALVPLKEAFAAEKDEWPKIEMAIALSKFGDDEAFEFLLDELQHSKYKKDMIIRGLGEIGNPRAIKPLLTEYQLHKEENSCMDPKINVLIGRSLIMLGNPKGIPILKRYLKSYDLYIMKIARDTLHNKEKWLAREKKEKNRI